MLNRSLTSSVLSQSLTNGTQYSQEEDGGIPAYPNRVFLGGTTNSHWRNEFKLMLGLESFDPVVENWSEEHQAEERHQRQECGHLLYVLTAKMQGFFAVAEVTEDSVKRPDKTVLVILSEDEGETFSDQQQRSMDAVRALVETNGVRVFDDLESAADYYNSM